MLTTCMQVFRLSETLNFSIFKEKKNNITVFVFFSCVVYFTTLSEFQNIQGCAEVT